LFVILIRQFSSDTVTVVVIVHAGRWVLMITHYLETFKLVVVPGGTSA